MKVDIHCTKRVLLSTLNINKAFYHKILELATWIFYFHLASIWAISITHMSFLINSIHVRLGLHLYFLASWTTISSLLTSAHKGLHWTCPTILIGSLIYSQLEQLLIFCGCMHFYSISLYISFILLSFLKSATYIFWIYIFLTAQYSELKIITLTLNGLNILFAVEFSNKR